MKYAILCLFSIMFSFSQAQHVLSLDTLSPTNDNNIVVQPIGEDSTLFSTYVIWVRDSVKAHYHAHHAEQLYILEGAGDMKIDDVIYPIEPGDYVLIPAAAIHSVKTTSAIPLKVISTQCPHFEGVDRVFVE